MEKMKCVWDFETFYSTRKRSKIVFLSYFLVIRYFENSLFFMLFCQKKKFGNIFLLNPYRAVILFFIHSFPFIFYIFPSFILIKLSNILHGLIRNNQPH